MVIAHRAATKAPIYNRWYVALISSVAALGGLLFGYDTAVISGAIGLLQRHFQLSAATTGWLASCALAGCVLGAACAGWVSDAFGRRSALVLSSTAFLLSSIGTALASGAASFVVFRIIGGLGIGAAAMVSPMYIAEVAPTRWRGRLVALNQLALVLGMLLIYFVNYEIARIGSDEWNLVTGWRWMFASGAVPALLLFMLLFLVPETPRFLFLKGREADARAVLLRIENETTAVSELQQMLESRVVRVDLWTAGDARNIGIVGLILAVLQQISGINVFLYYAPELFKHAGVSSNGALIETIVLGIVNVCFTILSMVLVDRIGRKPLWILGSVGMGLSLFAVGFAFLIPYTGIVLLLLTLAYIACFACSVGPVTWVILSEIFPTQFRSRLMSIATVALWSANFVVSQTFPMLDQNPWLTNYFHHGFPFFLYGVFCFLGAWFAGTQLPETKGKTLEEIEQWWRNRK
jgi:MFS transporter, SP family, xylose:H+ symportor